MPNPIRPVIKWSGSKRSVAPHLATLFPSSLRYFEPFVGGGALLPFRQSGIAYASDIMPELIAVWIAIRDRPREMADGYRGLWSDRQRHGHTVYYAVRDRFNKTRDPIDFLFLSRTCVNGLIRFNRTGEFNNSLHHTRPGIAPDSLEEIILSWSGAIQGVAFDATDYRAALRNVAEGDFVFLDPPYAATRGRYRPDCIDVEELYSELERLSSIGAKWMLTYDGEAGKRKYEAGLSPHLYKVKLGITTGNSPFTRLMGTTLDAVVESVYLNYQPSRQIVGSSLDERDQPVQLSVNFDVSDSSTFHPIEFKSQD